MNALLIALQFLTRLPLPAVQDWREDELARAIPMFPLVGAVIGLALGGCFLRSMPGGGSAEIRAASEK